jgi:hypothetical protein
MHLFCREGIYFAVKEVHISPGDRKAQQCVEQLEQVLLEFSDFVNRA